MLGDQDLVGPVQFAPEIEFEIINKFLFYSRTKVDGILLFNNCLLIILKKFQKLVFIRIIRIYRFPNALVHWL